MMMINRIMMNMIMMKIMKQDDDNAHDDDLQQSALESSANAAVQHHLHVEAFSAPQVVHHVEQLKDECILTKIIAHFKHQHDALAAADTATSTSSI